MEHQAEEIFQSMDFNADGRLTPHEFSLQLSDQMSHMLNSLSHKFLDDSKSKKKLKIVKSSHSSRFSRGRSGSSSSEDDFMHEDDHDYWVEEDEDDCYHH